MRDWKREIYEVHPNLVPLEDIKSGSIKFRAKCSIDGYEWEYRGYDLLRGFGCHQCKGVPRYTTDTFKEKIKSIHPNIEIIGEYQGSHVKIEFECLTCGVFGLSKPNTLFNGSACRQCGIKKRADKLRKGTEKFKQEFNLIVGDEYTVLGEYKTIDDDIEIRHNICGFNFNSRPHNLLKKIKPTRCPKCNGGVRKKTKEYHNQEIQALTNGEYSFISEYKCNNIKSVYIHHSCGREFYTNPDSFLCQGTRCPYCYSSSKGEVEIFNFLESNHIEFIREKTFKGLKDKGFLRFDFFLKEYNACIEYDGKQHFEPIEIFGGQKEFESRKKKDSIKDKYCLDNGIKLLRIPYYEKDIEGTIKSFIEKVSVQYV